MQAHTATDSSVYSICLNLRSRLLSLPGFSLFSELLLDDALYPDPVSCIQELFCLGIPLCYLFNLLPPRTYPRIDLDFTRTQNEDYSSRFAVALFALRTSQIFGSEYFTIMELLDRESTAGLKKAANAVLIILQALPEARLMPQVSGSTTKPTKPRVHRFNSMSRFEREWNEYVCGIIKSEQQYIRDMEALEELSLSLVTAGAMDNETSSLVFPKKLFTFVRKFRLQLECVSELPWYKQKWGHQFVTHAMDFEVIYQIYCVNRVLAKPTLSAVDTNSIKVSGHDMSAKDMNILLDMPVQHLSEYLDALNGLICILTLEDSAHDNLEDLHPGRTALRGVINSLHRAQQQAKTDQIRDSLKKRINDWDGLDMDNMGLLLLNDNMPVRRNEIIQKFDVFLFEKVFLLCDEVLPPAASPRIGRRKAASVSSSHPTLPSLYIKDHCRTKDILSTKTSMLKRAEDTGSRIYYELSLSIGAYTISLLCQNEEIMSDWQSKIESIRGVQENHTRSRRAYSANNVLDKLDFTPVPKDHNSGGLLNVASINTDNRVFVQLRYGSSTFVLAIPLPIEYKNLVERVEKKLRFCHGWSKERLPTITHTTNEGYVEPITPSTDLVTVFDQGTRMVHLSVQ